MTKNICFAVIFPWFNLFKMFTRYAILMQVFIVLSCLISISVNFSTFLVIGKTSPVTYQVLGHLKTCLVLGFGYVLLHDPFSLRNIFGILIALVGMIIYSYFCSLESQQKASEASAQLSQVPWSMAFTCILHLLISRICSIKNVICLSSDILGVLIDFLRVWIKSHVLKIGFRFTWNWISLKLLNHTFWQSSSWSSYP